MFNQVSSFFSDVVAECSLSSISDRKKESNHFFFPLFYQALFPRAGGVNTCTRTLKSGRLFWTQRRCARSCFLTRERRGYFVERVRCDYDAPSGVFHSLTSAVD